MARPVYKIDNSHVKEAMMDFMSFYDAPSWMNDIIRGAKGQVSTGTNQISSSTVFRLIQSLDEISTKTVGEALNLKQEAITGEKYSVRMVEYYTAAARCASQGIFHRLSQTVVDEVDVKVEVGFSFKQDAINYAIAGKEARVYGFGMTRDFTEEERETVRRLSISGSTQELNDYINSIK